jgi:UMF1 family MFS transporter
MAAVSAGGLASWLRAPAGVSAIGGGIASPVGQISWAMFDFARNPYVLLITIYIFATYFTGVLAYDPKDTSHGQAVWGAIQGYAGLVIAALAPFLGAIADAGGRRKPWIVFFAAVLALTTGALWFAKADGTGLSLFMVCALAAIAAVAYEFASVFYNAMLPSIVPHARVGSLSGLGLALGNLSSLLLLIFMLVFFALPGQVSWSFIPAHPLFGIDQATYEPARLTGPLTALCIFVFTLPLLIWTPDRANAHAKWGEAAIKGFKSVIRTARSLRHYRNVATYLLARLFFNDGMTALLIFSGVFALSIFGWKTLAMTAYGITASIFAVIGGFLGGWLDDHIGSKPALFVTVGGTVVFGLMLVTMGPERIFWLIHFDVHAPPLNSLPFFRTWPEIIYMGVTCLAAVCVSASYANARTMMARIAPAERITEFFGLYSLSGQSTSFFATLSVSWVTAWTHSQRSGFSVILVFLVVGLIGMIWVKEERAQAI